MTGTLPNYLPKINLANTHKRLVFEKYSFSPTCGPHDTQFRDDILILCLSRTTNASKCGCWNTGKILLTFLERIKKKRTMSEVAGRS